ncbi:MAG: hypothetical protein C0513_02265 [Isosphaera sp.]|nr:hypothetical protein [Isosphaera sp.]
MSHPPAAPATTPVAPARTNAAPQASSLARPRARVRLTAAVLLAAASGPLTACAAISADDREAVSGAVASVSAFQDVARAVGLAQFPSLSPDGRVMVFTWLGDLWAAPVEGGIASRLTAHASPERRSAVWGPAGGPYTVAFESSRDGGRSIYTAPLALRDPGAGPAGGFVLGEIRRVTFTGRALSLYGFTPDGRELLLNGQMEPEIFRGVRMYSVRIDGPRTAEGDRPESAGAPIVPLSQAYGYNPRPTADGKGVLFYRRRADFNRPRYTGPGNADLWRMDLPAGPGQEPAFTRLTSSAHNDGDGFGLPDGSVVYMSSRDGTNNLYLLGPGQDDGSSGGPKQLTFFKPSAAEVTLGHGVRDLAVSQDGSRAVFAVWDTLYSLDLGAARSSLQPVAPRAVRMVGSADATELDYVRQDLSRQVSEAAVSPDGQTVAVIARGQVFIRPTAEGRPTRRLTSEIGRASGLAWSPDGRTLFFASDAGGPSQLYYATVSLTRSDLGASESEAAGQDDQEKKPEPPTQAAAEASNEESSEAGQPAEPPAAAPTEPPADPKADEPKADGAPAQGEAKPAAKPKAPKVDHGKRWAESLEYTVTRLELPGLPTGPNDGVLGVELRDPQPSPDGTKLLAIKGLGDLVLIDLFTKQSRVIFAGWDAPQVRWAADSRHVVYERQDLDFNSDLWLQDTAPDAAGALPAATNLTRHPDLDSSPRLSADGKVLYFLAGRGDDGQFDVYAVNLDRTLDGMAGYERDEYFKKAAEAAKKRAKPIEPVLWDTPGATPPAKPLVEPLVFGDLSDVHLRARVLVGTLGSKNGLEITPGGDRVIFSGAVEGAAGGGAAPGAPGVPGAGDGPGAGRAVYNVSFKNDDRKTITTGGAGGVAVTRSGDKVSFVRGGQALTSGINGGRADTLGIDAPVTVDIARLQRQKFLEGARAIGNGFYSLKGLDWRALSERYAGLAQLTRTPDEFDRVFSLLLGELDGSHTGITSPRTNLGAGEAPETGFLGVDTDPAPGGYRVRRVIPRGPADVQGAKLKVGDLITSIDGVRLSADAQSPPRTDLHAALSGAAGREVIVSYVPAGVPAGGGAEKRSLITPISDGAETNLRYAAETERRRAEVDRLSGGRLGYLHIRGMDAASVRAFERDLYAAAHGKEGLIIDVRDNGGGSTADILLSSLTAPRHTYTVPRGADAAGVPKDSYPRDRRLIYGYNRPITVMINENSFSNAEIFAHAVKTIGRGKLVGTQTFGGVISTGAATLIDGTTVRMPFRGWYLPDGRDLESNGAAPDIDVPQLPQDEHAGRDAQLSAAVAELMTRATEATRQLGPRTP